MAAIISVGSSSRKPEVSGTDQKAREDLDLAQLRTVMAAEYYASQLWSLPVGEKFAVLKLVALRYID